MKLGQYPFDYTYLFYPGNGSSIIYLNHVCFYSAAMKSYIVVIFSYVIFVCCFIIVNKVNVLHDNLLLNFRKYNWVDAAEGLTWAAFSSKFPKHRLWFYTLMDVSTSEERGWQQLALNLGLNTDEVRVSLQHRMIQINTFPLFY